MKAIDKMYELFGKNERFKCKTCKHLGYYERGRRRYKCDLYEIAFCASSEWRLKWDSCGLYNRPYTYTEVRRSKRRLNQPKGQLWLGNKMTNLSEWAQRLTDASVEVWLLEELGDVYLIKTQEVAHDIRRVIPLPPVFCIWNNDRRVLSIPNYLEAYSEWKRIVKRKYNFNATS